MQEINNERVVVYTVRKFSTYSSICAFCVFMYNTNLVSQPQLFTTDNNITYIQFMSPFRPETQYFSKANILLTNGLYYLMH